jgi:hypothetical protein
VFNLQKIRTFVQGSLKNVPTRLQHRISCGVQAFSLQEFSSINANGRSLALNRKTGESRAYRVCHDDRTAPLLSNLILKFLPHTPLIYCSLDHSQFGPFCIAVLSVSFRKGRAIPIWCQVNRSESGLMKPLLDKLKDLANDLSENQKLVLVMDRWFCGQKLFNLVSSFGWYFICRAKYSREVSVPWENGTIPIGEISLYETNCWYKGLKLRMVRSEIKPGMKEDEPWFLLTNLPVTLATRIQVLHRYAERFEIEECFKDMKWIQRFKHQQIKKTGVIQAVLLFLFFGWWIFWFISRDLTKSELKPPNPKHKLSWFRTVWEMFHQLLWPNEFRFTPLCP